MNAEAQFFIAERLRGIPLVSRRFKEETTSTERVKIAANQVGKRDVDKEVTGGLLFKPNAMTASTANLIRKKSSTSTTTRKPPTTNQRRASTMKPMKNEPILAKLIKNEVRSRPPKMVNSTMETTTTTTTTTTAKPTTVKQLDNYTSLQNLTRSAQTSPATAQAGFQRRTTQSVSSPHYTNKPYENNKMFAGENWVLFNRSDGDFSVFEMLVLVSNVLIVSTIILVTMFSWIRSIQKKRATTSIKRKQSIINVNMKEDLTTPANNSRSNSQAYSDRMSKMSLISSATSVPTTTTASEATEFMQTNLKAAKENENSPPLIRTLNNDISKTSNLGEQVIKSGNTVTSKATAIVQPTENNIPPNNAQAVDDKSKLNTLSALKEELNQSVRTINRSVSDLSSSISARNNTLKSADTNKTTDDAISEKERAKAIENPLNRSTPNLSLNNSRQLMKSKKEEDLTGSLESIELPENLVDLIKKSEAKNATSQIVPSPNLLLGQKESAPAPAVEVKVENAKKTEKEEKEKEKEVPSAKQASREEKNKSVETKQKKVDVEKNPTSSNSTDIRPENPMGRDSSDARESSNKNQLEPDHNLAQSSQVKNHQLVVNKLDKRKTNLEIVDIRDESVTGKMRNNESNQKEPVIEQQEGWISMDGVAVVQTAPSTSTAPQSPTIGNQIMSPSEIIETRFNVDYNSKRKTTAGNGKKLTGSQQKEDSMDSKMEESLLNNIDIELEQDNRLKNRKYFVYIVHDGHFTAKKECIARIEMPPKRRITLAELRSLIANSQDVSLSSLRKSKFKFVTETYRLLTENEDAAVLHQVYPTQGVFLKLNIPEQENPIYPYKTTRGRLMSGSSGLNTTTSSLAHTTIASRHRATARAGARNTNSSQNELPAIEVNGGASQYRANRARRASSVGRRGLASGKSGAQVGKALGPRSKSSVQSGRQRQRVDDGAEGADDKLPAIDTEFDDRRRSVTSMVLADMSEERMRILTPSKYCSRASCGRFATIRCDTCNYAHYCSVRCRACDWPQHKQFCKKPKWKYGTVKYDNK